MKHNYILSKILMLTFLLASVMVYARPDYKTIIFVGQDDATTHTMRTNDTALFNHLGEWIETVIYLHQADFNDASADTLYNNIAGIVISESIGSNGVGNFANRDDFPVPCITMEGGMFRETTDTDPLRWHLLDAGGGTWPFVSAGDGGGSGGLGLLSDIDLIWQITGETSTITAAYDADDTVRYSTDPTPTYGIGYIHGLPGTILATPARTEEDGCTGFIQSEAGAIVYVEDPKILFMSVPQDYPAFGTPDLWDVLFRACEFMFDVDTVNAINQLSANDIGLSVSPNPAVNDFTVSFNLDMVESFSIDLISITGGLVGKVYEGLSIAGNNVVNINTADFAPGLYLVELHIGNRVAHSKLIIK